MHVSSSDIHSLLLEKVFLLWKCTFFARKLLTTSNCSSVLIPSCVIVRCRYRVRDDRVRDSSHIHSTDQLPHWNTEASVHVTNDYTSVAALLPFNFFLEFYLFEHN